MGTTGDAPGQFRLPTGIAVDSDGYVYVVDNLNNRVQKFTANGGFIVSFGHSGEGALNDPYGIAVAGNGDVLVVNVGEKRVVVYQAPQ